MMAIDFLNELVGEGGDSGTVRVYRYDVGGVWLFWSGGGRFYDLCDWWSLGVSEISRAMVAMGHGFGEAGYTQFGGRND